jgi:hypothetical protein
VGALRSPRFSPLPVRTGRRGRKGGEYATRVAENGSGVKMTTDEEKWLRFCARLAALMRAAIESSSREGGEIEEASLLLDTDHALTDTEVRTYLNYIIFEYGGSPGFYMEVVKLLEQGGPQEDLLKYFKS